MNRHDLSDKHMRLQREAKQEEENREMEELAEDELLAEEVEENHWQKKIPPVKRKPPK